MESSCVPPGFRFHPTEEELLSYYLKRKINNLKIDLDVIVEIDLYRMEPWDIEDSCKLGYEEQKEWYFFSHKDRKYPTGTRTNRATTAGFWKATGRDKAVISKEKMIGMRKTLVFYKGRAPNGRKTDWIMHEYRLQTSEHGPPQEEGWVVCRAFKKPSPSQKQGFEGWNYMRNNYDCRPPPSYPPALLHNNFEHATNLFPQLDTLKSNCNSPFETQIHVDLPKLDSPSISTSFATNDINSFANEESHEDGKPNFGNQFSDWKSFDKLFAESEVVGSSSSSSYAYTSMPHNDDLSHVLECFPDL